MEQPATPTLADQNRDYWDEQAETAFEQEWVKALSRQLTRVIRDFAPLLLSSKDGSQGSPVRMLDYACGNGVASWALKPQVDMIRGIDIAPGMVTQYNKRAQETGVPRDAMRAYQGDLLAPTPSISTPDLDGFDLAITSMAFHHFPDPEAVLTALVSRLRPGGTVAVMDWAPGDDNMPWGEGGHEASHTIHADARRLLTWESVLPMLGRAGCDLATAYYAVVGEKSHMPEDRTKVPGGVYVNGFLAFAKKRAE